MYISTWKAQKRKAKRKAKKFNRQQAWAYSDKAFDNRKVAVDKIEFGPLEGKPYYELPKTYIYFLMGQEGCPEDVMRKCQKALDNK